VRSWVSQHQKKKNKKVHVEKVERIEDELFQKEIIGQEKSDYNF
jgi:hypothetical protein